MFYRSSKFIIIFSAIQVMGCGKISTHADLNHEQDESFVQLCQRRESLSAAQKHTINQILESQYTSDCVEAAIHAQERKELWLTSSNIEDVYPISLLKGMREVFLQRNKIRDISPLRNMTTITRLDLADNKIADYSHLSALIELYALNISGNLGNSLAFVKTLTKLGELTANQLSVESVADLKGLKSLGRLEMSGNKKTITDLFYLATENKTYWKLDFSNTQMTDIRWLEGIPAISRLDLSNNRISDLSPLRTIQGIDTLYLQKNRIADVSALDHLKETLSEVNLSQNLISDARPLGTLSRLFSTYQLVLTGNNILPQFCPTDSQCPALNAFCSVITGN